MALPQLGLCAESFYGDWWVHGSQVVFSPDGTGREDSHDGFTVDGRWLNEVLNFSTRLSDDRAVLTVTVTGRHFEALSDGPAEIVADPDPGLPGTRVGDVFALRFEQRHLIRVSPVRVQYVDASIGNPYLCGDNLAPEFQVACGA